MINQKKMYLLDKFSFLILILATSASAYITVPTQTKHPPGCAHIKRVIPYDVFGRSHRAEYGNCRLFYNFHVVAGQKSYGLASIAHSTKDDKT